MCTNKITLDQVVVFFILSAKVNIVMKILKTALISIILFNFVLSAYAANESTQILKTNLPEVLEIEKILVEDMEHERDAQLVNLQIKDTNFFSNDTTILTMTPLQVKIHTNLSTPITVNAQFSELKHTSDPYKFPDFNLSISPTSYTITNPYDHVVSEAFVPYAVIKPDTVPGDYIGTLIFTLGAL